MAQHKAELCGALRSNELLITNVIVVLWQNVGIFSA